MARGEINRTDEVLVNPANYLAPVPNGDESIVATDAGVKTLTPPNENNIKATISNPVACTVRFGAVPTATSGVYFDANQGFELESAEEIANCQIYVTAATTLFVQYWR